MEEGANTPNAASEKITERLKIILKSLESGDIQSLGDVQSRLETKTEKALIKGASLLRSFDENLYVNTLQLIVPEGSPKISFDEFTQNPNVELVPRMEKVFRIKDDVQKLWIDEWGRELNGPSVLPVGITETDTPFLQNLLTEFKNGKRYRELDLLGVLILTDPKGAAEKFLKLFEKADKNFDLARCHDVVKILEDRAPLLSPELVKLAQQHRQYLRARNLFAQDYYQTVFYLARPSIVQAFDNLLKNSSTDSQEWIFHLYATGGMGKTMFVKWLISRHCVIQKIPVARLDFDDLHLPTVGRYPWLLILEVAAQLNQQIVGSPFNEPLSSYWPFVSLLHHPGETRNNKLRFNLEKQLQSSESNLHTTLLNRFADTLIESGFQNPFVVVFDTLENMVLQNKRSLMAVLKGLGEIRDSYPQMRLLLSGRYNLLERLTEFKTNFSPQTVAHELKPFSSKESRIYLTEKRGLRDEAIIDAIIEKCEGRTHMRGGDQTDGSNPFKLSLFADLYQQKEVTQAKEILSYPRTDFAYLINRIVERIKEPEVQWLLRYAVVPRQFTFEFFEEVIAYHLEEELIKNRKLDEVNKKYPRGAEVFENQEKFKYVKKAKSLNIHGIWRHLRKYASNYGWISFNAGDDSAPRFQPDVVVPMRLLLERQQIFKPLHTAAAIYFEKKAKAESDPGRWAQHICEAVYHHFQQEGAKAAVYWRKQINSAHAQRHPSVRKMIAEEITGKDYVDEAGKPIQNEDKQLLVNYPDLREARLRTVEAAVASIAYLKRNEHSAEWTNVTEHLAEVAKLSKRKLNGRGNYEEFFDITSVLNLATQMGKTRVDYRLAVPLLRKAISETTSKQMILGMEIMLADALARLNDAEALTHYEQALRLKKLHRYSHVSTSEIRLKVAGWFHNQKEFIRAEELYLATLPLAKREKNDAVIQNTLRYLADINLEFGRYDQAIRFLEEVQTATRGEQVEEEGEESQPLLDALLVGQIHARTLHEPLEALRGIQPHLESAATDRERAALCELQGDIFGKLMRFDDALTRIEEAKDLWTKASDSFGTDRARILRAELQLVDIGNLTAADSQLQKMEQFEEGTDLEIVTHVRLLRLLWNYLYGNKRAAIGQWRLLAKDKKVRQSPRASVRVLAMGLALGLGSGSTVNDFIENLKKVKPPSARLPLLGDFAYAELSFRASPEERRAIKRLVNAASKGRDIIPHALLRAGVLGCCGETSLAKMILDEAGSEARKRNNSFAYRNILLAKDRLGEPVADKDDLFASTFFEDFAEYPNLCAAGSIEQAERYLKLGKIRESRESLNFAQERLKQTNLMTHWHAKVNELFGDAARIEAGVNSAFSSYSAALSVYEQLGNKPAVENLLAKMPNIGRQPVFDEELFTIRMDATSKTLRVESIVGGKSEYQDKFSGAASDSLLRIIKAETKDRSAIYDFSKMLVGDSLNTENGFGAILQSKRLVDRLTIESKKERRSDLRIDSLPPSLAKMPWEFTRFEGRLTDSAFRYFYRSALQAVRNNESVKWLQLVLRNLIDPTLPADGVSGPRTQAAVELLKSKYKLPEQLWGPELNARIGELLVRGKSERKTKALVIRPRQEQQIKSQRNISFGGPSVEWWYEDCYFTVKTLAGEEIDQLKYLLTDFQPDVIHVQSSFKEIPTTGQIYLDFGYTEPTYSTSRSSQFGGKSFSRPSPAYINDSLALLPSAKLSPVVVLDAVAPPGITEAVHQLLYRNAFASELFQLGNASCVIAAGLSVNGELQMALVGDLISGLSNTETFGDVVNKMKKHHKSETLDVRIPTLGIALFTNEPELTIMTSEKHYAGRGKK